METPLRIRRSPFLSNFPCLKARNDSHKSLDFRYKLYDPLLLDLLNKLVKEYGGAPQLLWIVGEVVRDSWDIDSDATVYPTGTVGIHRFSAHCSIKGIYSVTIVFEPIAMSGETSVLEVKSVVNISTTRRTDVSPAPENSCGASKPGELAKESLSFYRRNARVWVWTRPERRGGSQICVRIVKDMA